MLDQQGGHSAIQQSKVLTGSVSQDVESPFLFDYFAIATWGGWDLMLSIKDSSFPYE